MRIEHAFHILHDRCALSRIVCKTVLHAICQEWPVSHLMPLIFLLLLQSHAKHVNQLGLNPNFVSLK